MWQVFFLPPSSPPVHFIKKYNLTPQEDSLRATGLRTDRIIASPVALADLCAYLHAWRPGPTHGIEGPDPGPSTETEIRIEWKYTVEDAKALVMAWKPYQLWYILEVGNRTAVSSASVSAADIFQSTAFREWHNHNLRSGAGGGSRGLEDGNGGGEGGAAALANAADLFSALINYSASLRQREIIAWARGKGKRVMEGREREAKRRVILATNLKHEVHFMNMLRGLDEVDERELKLEADFVGLESEFLAFCGMSGVRIVPWFPR